MTEASFDYGYSTYLPSILFIDDDKASSRELRQRLEKRGCQVHQTNFSPAGLAAAHKNYFELIVLHIESLKKDLYETCKLLETDSELATIPMVILTTCDLAQESTKQLETKYPVYCLSAKNAFAEVRLWQIIEQTHYMTHRYM